MGKPNYDLLAAQALLAGDKKLIKALKAHAEGRYTCPDCGHEGPHDVQSDGFGTQEYNCSGCGMVHHVPPVPGEDR
jgi:predicted RNA-binding Zn-ribbon protein involved in translation (DUF1610 family)